MTWVDLLSWVRDGGPLMYAVVLINLLAVLAVGRRLEQLGTARNAVQVRAAALRLVTLTLGAAALLALTGVAGTIDGLIVGHKAVACNMPEYNSLRRIVYTLALRPLIFATGSAVPLCVLSVLALNMALATIETEPRGMPAPQPRLI